MLRIAVFCLVILQIVTAEPPPPHCMGPPPGMKHAKECCNFPRVFKEEDFKECGIERPSDDGEGYHHHGPPDCNKHICLLKKYNLMKDDTNVDKDAVETFMNKWLEGKGDYKDAVDVAIKRCLKEEIPGLPEMCEVTKVIFCVGATMFMNCPKWGDTDVCQKMKAHIDECKPYFN